MFVGVLQAGRLLRTLTSLLPLRLWRSVYEDGCVLCVGFRIPGHGFVFWGVGVSPLLEVAGGGISGIKKRPESDRSTPEPVLRNLKVP